LFLATLKVFTGVTRVALLARFAATAGKPRQMPCAEITAAIVSMFCKRQSSAHSLNSFF
jgi:hypothetical protein